MSALISEVKSWQSVTGKPIVGGKVYVGVVDLDPVLNPEPIFSDRELTVPLANPVTLDSYGNPTSKIWVAGRYSIRVDDANGAKVHEELDNGEDPGIISNALTNIQGSDTITADGNPTISALVDKAKFSMTIATANSGAVTVQVDATAAKSLKRNLDQDIVKGQFQVGQVVEFTYNETADAYEWTNHNNKVIYETQGADIASATTVDLSAATGNKINLTGSDGPITGFGMVVSGATYDLIYTAPAAVTITSSSVASPTNILCDTAHNLTSGQTVIIASHSGSVPDINGEHVVTVVDPTNFTIPVNVTTGGTGGTFRPGIVFTHNATSLQLMGQANITLKDGDGLRVKSLGSGNWKGIGYFTYDSNLIQLAKQGEAEAGTNNTKGMTPLRVAQAIGVIGKPEVFTADGTYNVPLSVTSLLIEARGGGGGGGDGFSLDAGGGGAGGTILAVIPATAGGTEAVVIGQGGAGGNGGSGSAGTASTVGSTKVSAGGGVGGQQGGGGAGGAGGTNSTTGTVIRNVQGGAGQAGQGGGTDGVGGIPEFNAVTTAPGSGGAGGDPTGTAGQSGYVIITPIS